MGLVSKQSADRGLYWIVERTLAYRPASATRERQSGAPSGLPAPNCSSCRPTAPDLNPIEQVFAKLKSLLRNAAERTVEATWRRIGALLSAFSPANAPTTSSTRDMLQNKAAALYGGIDPYRPNHMATLVRSSPTSMGCLRHLLSTSAAMAA